MLPLVVEITPVPPDGLVIVSPFVPLPELIDIAEAPLAEMSALRAVSAPRTSKGVLIVSEPPFPMVSVTPVAIEIDPPVAWELKLTVPLEPGLKFSALVNES